MDQNRLKPENCNTTHCISCIFHPDKKKRLGLDNGRIIEITQYLTNFTSSHICHKTDKTCYGGLLVTAKALFKRKIIPQPTVESLLETAKLFI